LTTRKVELLAMLAIGVDTDVIRALGPKQMHGVGDHHGTFDEMM
jgi:hypothetical protein